ncbi:AAC(3) family N-acetyltransferase [Balneatrix alpica]|uniref:Aminoglycoside N(3)-acetyltransferase n=1 Tax=Balneatrix alpica TaxID=75684 RepID=A0ABV5ZFJ3_9GAMM|nr:AAC(3) family N-acetyltransferase [Balneatrix alpica]
MSDTSSLRALQEALDHTLDALAVQAGEVLMVHGDAMLVAQFGLGAEGIEALFRQLEQRLGPTGTLILPSFSYSLTQGEVFDVRHTPSQVGMLSEAFRQRPGVLRTLEPIFSVAVSGAAATSLSVQENHDCFGEESLFAWLHHHNARLLGLACAADRITFTHYVEQCLGVDYRYYKTFQGQLCDHQGRLRPWHSRYLVRDTERATQVDLRLLQQRMQQQGLWQRSLCGRLPVWSVRCQDFYQSAAALVAQQPNGLIREGANHGN